MVERPPAGTIPDLPGSYQFRDADGRIIYVGKAKSLRQRLSNYFADPRSLHVRTAQMVAAAETVEWITVRNEVEALMLEYNLIKTHRPRFNVRLVDDKSYPYLALTLGDEWPRAMVMRGKRTKPNPLLRAVRPRLCDPRDARPAAAHLSHPHVHRRQVQAICGRRPSLPAVSHREVLGTLRGGGESRRLRRDARRPVQVSRGRHPAGARQPAWAHERRGRSAGV
jgi:hypothetical protein